MYARPRQSLLAVPGQNPAVAAKGMPRPDNAPKSRALCEAYNSCPHQIVIAD